MLSVSFGPRRLIGRELISIGAAQQPLSINWEYQPNQLYGLFIVDYDAPYPDPRNINSPYLHYAVINIRDNDVSTGDVLASYLPPNPPTDSPAHRYQIVLAQQEQGRVQTSPISQRERFDLNLFLTEAGMMKLESLDFYVGQQMMVPTAPGRVLTPMPRPSQYPTSKADYFKPEVTLGERQKSFCRCILHTAAKQSDACNREKAWYQQREGQTCYNPYAVCAKSTGTSSRQCGVSYDYHYLPDDELRAYANLNQVPVPEPYDRNQMLANIMAWKASKGQA